MYMIPDRAAHSKCTETDIVSVAVPARQQLHASAWIRIMFSCTVFILGVSIGDELYSHMAGSCRTDLFRVDIRCIASSLTGYTSMGLPILANYCYIYWLASMH